MDGAECKADEVKLLETSKTSDNKVSIYLQNDPETSKVMSPTEQRYFRLETID